jgi:Transposase DDE domain
MHRRIDTTLHRLRQDLTDHLDEAAIHDVCERSGHIWRDCLLTPFAIVHWLLLQVLNGNTALNHITLQARRPFTDSAYCQARSRLPLAVLRGVLRNLIKALVPDTEREGLWRGHRTLLIDGSSFSMPDTPALQEHFGQPGNQAPGCGFPVAKILALFHHGTGLLLEVTAAPLRSHEMAHVDGVHPTLKPGDVLVGDRGFCSFAHLALLAGRGVHAVLRIHQKQVVDFTSGRPHSVPGDRKALAGLPRSRWVRSLGASDQVVEWFKPVKRPEWMTAERYAALPETITVREARYTVDCPGFRTRVITLVTTLLDAELYPLRELAELYFARWRVEQNLRGVLLT